MKYKRGDICYYNFGKQKSRIQGGYRPCVIIGNNYQNNSSSICVVVPITTAHKKQLPTHIELVPISNSIDKVEGTILCEQIMTVNQTKLKPTSLSLDQKTLVKLNQALSIELDLDFCQDKEKSEYLEAITYMKDTISSQRKELFKIKMFMEEIEQMMKDNHKLNDQKVLQFIKSLK